MVAMDWVLIEHPKLDGPPARVTRRAYDRVWKAKGFRLVKPKKAKDENDG